MRKLLLALLMALGVTTAADLAAPVAVEAGPLCDSSFSGRTAYGWCYANTMRAGEYYRVSAGASNGHVYYGAWLRNGSNSIATAPYGTKITWAVVSTRFF